MALRPKVIINADGLGLNAWNNDRIFEAFDNGWISSASIMPNMPWFDEAAKLVHERGLVDRIGLHVTLDAGVPLTDKLKVFFPDGQLQVPRRYFLGDTELVDAIGHEIDAQIRRARGAALPLSHADSHHHLHTHWSVLSQMLPACLDNDIHSVRLAGNILYPSSMQKRVYRNVVNRKIRAAGFITTQKFTHLDRFLAVMPTLDDSMVIELMVHPGLEDEYCQFKSDNFARLLDSADLISYTQYQKMATPAAGDRLTI